MPLGNRKKANPSQVIRILYWCLVVSGVYFAYLNVQPYAKAVSFLAGRSTSQSLTKLLSFLPPNYWLVLKLGVFGTLGVILWGLIQIIQLLPLLIYNNDEIMLSLIQQSDGRKKFISSDNEDPTLKALKGVYNAIPYVIIKRIRQLRLFSYVIDFFICMAVYPPVSSGKITELGWILLTGQWGKIDWSNVLLLFCTIGIVEVIVSLILWLGKLSFVVQPQPQN